MIMKKGMTKGSFGCDGTAVAEIGRQESREL